MTQIPALIALLNVVTFNIWGVPDVAFKINTPYRAERVERICKELKLKHADSSGWDVVFLQEAWLTSDREVLKSDCGYEYALDLDSDHKLLDSGLLILSRYPIDQAESDRLIFSESGSLSRVISDGEFVVRKSAIAAKILHPRLGAIWAINTHLISQYDQQNDVYFETRAHQLKELAAWVSSKSESSPLILGGDFNFGSDHLHWKDLVAYFPKFSGLAPADALQSYRREFSTLKDSLLSFDHLLASPHFESLGAKTTFDFCVSIEKNCTPVSDHLGIENRYQIKSEIFAVPESYPWNSIFRV